MIGVFHPSNKPLLQVSNLDQNGTWILCAVKMISAITTSFPGPFPWFGSGDPQAREKALPQGKGTCSILKAPPAKR